MPVGQNFENYKTKWVWSAVWVTLMNFGGMKSMDVTAFALNTHTTASVHLYEEHKREGIFTATHTPAHRRVNTTGQHTDT